MAATKITSFKGIRPRIPDSLLAEGEATVAQNCDFAYGELRNVKGGFGLFTLSNTPSSIYTEDGLSFYSWTSDVNAVRSPMVNDTFNRLYYTGDGGMKVASRLGMKTTGGTPSSSYLVGVPRPTVAPVLTALQAEQVTTANATIVFKFHWEYGGVKYQEQAITPTPINNTQYQFTPSARRTRSRRPWASKRLSIAGQACDNAATRESATPPRSMAEPASTSVTMASALTAVNLISSNGTSTFTSGTACVFYE